MVVFAFEIGKSFNKCGITEGVIDAKTIYVRAPSPFSALSMPCTPQINKAGTVVKRHEKISAVEPYSIPLDIKVVSTCVEVANYDQRYVMIF